MTAFPGIEKIDYEGPDSKNPLAFRHYNESELVEGKSMKDHLRFSVAYWHTFRGTGSDPFGPGHDAAALGSGQDSVENAIRSRARGIRVHREARRPVLLLPRPRRRPRGPTLAETNKNLDAVVKVLKEEQQRTGIKLLVGHGQPVQQSPLHARRGHQPQRRRLRLRRGPGEEGPGGHQGTGRPGLRVLGRPRRLPDAAGTPT